MGAHHLQIFTHGVLEPYLKRMGNQGVADRDLENIRDRCQESAEVRQGQIISGVHTKPETLGTLGRCGEALQLLRHSRRRERPGVRLGVELDTVNPELACKLDLARIGFKE